MTQTADEIDDAGPARTPDVNVTAAAAPATSTADTIDTVDATTFRRLPPEYFRIPDALNACVITAQLAAIFTCFHLASRIAFGWPLALLAAAFALIMVGVFSIIHEAQHGVLFRNAKLNTAGGILMSAFFPGPFHLLRQGHIGHHLRNRSDDEAFDFWFAGESPLWKWIQLIGILTGGFYVMTALGNVVVLFLPFLLHRRWFVFDRPSSAFMDSLNPKYARIMAIEAAGVIAMHCAIVTLMRIPLLNYLVLYGAFGFLWSALQYVHHFGTERHVTRGAKNLWIGWLIDKLWLNHNWHRTHHEYPTVSWLYLERVGKQQGDDRTFLVWSYLKMWAGPRRATENVQNRFAGKVIR
jgi:fatty acid desaturase